MKRDDAVKEAVSVARRGAARVNEMSRIRRELISQALSDPRPGFFAGRADLWRAQRGQEMTSIVARRAEDLVRVARAAEELEVIDKETEVRLGQLDLDLERIEYAIDVIQLQRQGIQQERLLAQLTLGDRARIAMTQERRRLVAEQAKLAAAQGCLREVQRKMQLPAADLDELVDDGEFNDFVEAESMHARRR